MENKCFLKIAFRSTFWMHEVGHPLQKCVKSTYLQVPILQIFFPVKFALFSLKFKWFWKNYWKISVFFSLQLKWFWSQTHFNWSGKKVLIWKRVFFSIFWRKTRLFYVLRKWVKISALNLLFSHFNWSGSGARGYFNRSGKNRVQSNYFYPLLNRVKYARLREKTTEKYALPITRFLLKMEVGFTPFLRP